MQEITEQERLRRRRSVVLLVSFAAVALLIGLYPSVRSYYEQPQGYWKTYAEAPHTGPDALPAQVPASATEIHTRHDVGSGRRWVRFTFAPADHGRVTAGLRRMTLNEARGLPIDGPAFSPWWTLNERTMLGRAGTRVEAYEVPGTPRAWLFIDPSGNAGFYWSLAN
jgi:hypothetical protein